MLDFQNKPSNRLVAASSVISTINKNPSLFASIKVLESGINILYTRESLWNEKKQQSGNVKLEGRSEGGVMKSALSYFEAISELGVQANFKEISEFDFSKNDYTGMTMVLAHQISIGSEYWQGLQDFVSKGGKLIAEGLTAFYDEHAVSLMNTGFPLERMFGGNISEFKAGANLFKLQLTEPRLELPAHLWRGIIVPSTGKAIGSIDNNVIALRNKFGKGEVLWIPTLVGLASRMNKDYSQLATLLQTEAKQSIANVPVRFNKHQPNMLMKIITAGSSLVTVLINKSSEKRSLQLQVQGKLSPTILYANKNGSVTNNTLQISAEETIVIEWR